MKLTKSYRKNGSGEWIWLGVLGALGFVVYEYFSNNSISTVVAPPLTSNTTIAAASQATSNSNAANKYMINSADLQAIYSIAVNQGHIQNGLAQFPIWAAYYNLYKGFQLPAGDPDTTTPLTASEFGNWVNNWVSNQGLSGLGIIGKNYGPPAFTQPSAGYFGVLNALSRG